VLLSHFAPNPTSWIAKAWSVCDHLGSRCLLQAVLSPRSDAWLVKIARSHRGDGGAVIYFFAGSVNNREVMVKGH
jgi:hypothetical protein